jgi:hypothetical protein
MDISHRVSVFFLPRPTQPADHWRGCCVSNLLVARRGRAWRSVPLAPERAQRYARSWVLLRTTWHRSFSLSFLGPTSGR